VKLHRLCPPSLHAIACHIQILSTRSYQSRRETKIRETAMAAECPPTAAAAAAAAAANEPDEKGDWSKSEAKQILLGMLRDGSIPLTSEEMGPQVAYMTDAEFAKWPYTQFRDRLNDYRKSIRGKKVRASFDEEALLHDRSLFPKQSTTSSGKPRWEGSEAERLLKLDVEEGKHNNRRPEGLYFTKLEYTEFDLEVFRRHIYQEVETRKFAAFLENKAAKKAEKRQKKKEKKAG